VPFDRSLDASEQSDASAPPAPDPTASWYVRRDEDQDRAKTSLKFALKELADRLQRQLDFQSLQLLELLFYAQARNKNIAALLGVDEQHVGLQKHRWLKQLRKDASAALGDNASADFPDPLLTQVWEEQRPTCPKRTTIGSYLLGSLDDPGGNTSTST